MNFLNNGGRCSKTRRGFCWPERQRETQNNESDGEPWESRKSGIRVKSREETDKAGGGEEWDTAVAPNTSHKTLIIKWEKAA